MKELDSFTVEQLNDFIKSDHAQCGDVAALARIALAAKRAEPVAWEVKGILCHSKEEADSYVGEPVPLYEAPQLNSLEMPDGWKLVPIEPTQNMVDAHISGMQLAGFSRAYRDMLAAAPEPQKQQQNIPEIILQGWIKCSDQMPEVGDVVITAYQGCTNVGQMERSGKTYRYFTSIASGRELPATHWMTLPAAPEKPL
ncbi:TPA: DUF551 domain-containing protein [Yersinia enterocolitica]|uniref:DUF551 domain-containing protein n=1 Tax=Yersinia enterocolitica TaxID=630 RepID=UPI002963B6FC|nr:DUF551 domain-containing protein [Yersinia enterocolitica]HEF7264021.1 DUF551 domain-containing protein [Yersinia enterocolitica]HEN3563992.1 DUF551 domain-containing protein [Yersinia enterocolitica]